MKTDPRIDEKIAWAAPFARPILTHLRRLVHEGCPDAEETIKWGMPFFLHRGRSMCHMAAFKAHCILGFWHPELEKSLAREGFGEKSGEAAGLLGRITRLEDLPDDATILRLVAEAARHNESGKPARPRPPGTPAGRKPPCRPTWHCAWRATPWPPGNSRPSAPATDANTSSGSPRPSARKPA